MVISMRLISVNWLLKHEKKKETGKMTLNLNRRDLFKGASGLALMSTPVQHGRRMRRFRVRLPASEVRDTLSLDKGWRFFEGDIPFPEPIGNSATYDSTKTGAAGGAAALNFDDTEWQSGHPAA